MCTTIYTNVYATTNITENETVNACNKAINDNACLPHNTTANATTNSTSTDTSKANTNICATATTNAAGNTTPPMSWRTHINFSTKTNPDIASSNACNIPGCSAYNYTLVSHLVIPPVGQPVLLLARIIFIRLIPSTLLLLLG